MALTLSAPVRVSRNLWLIKWSGATGPFKVYRDGRLIATTEGFETTIMVSENEYPVIEVRDDDESPALGFPRQLKFQWAKTLATDHYLIQKFVASSWDLIARIPDNGQEYFDYVTGILADVTIHQFRVLPVGTNGNEGTAKTWAVLVVGHPDIPAVTLTWNSSTHKINVAAT